MECASTGKTVITAEEGRKIELVYQSVMALPLGQWLVESAGHAESSIYWEDPETGICVGAVRTRYPWISLDHGRENYGGYSTIQNRLRLPLSRSGCILQWRLWSTVWSAANFRFWLPAQLLNADVIRLKFSWWAKKQNWQVNRNVTAICEPCLTAWIPMNGQLLRHYHCPAGRKEWPDD